MFVYSEKKAQRTSGLSLSDVQHITSMKTLLLPVCMWGVRGNI